MPDDQLGHITHLPTMPTGFDPSRFRLITPEIPKAEREAMEYILRQEVRINELRAEQQSDPIDAELARLHRMVDHAYRCLLNMRRHAMPQPLIFEPLEDHHV